MWTVIDSDNININIIKFEEMIVAFQFSKDTIPTITINEYAQLAMDTVIHKKFLKIKELKHDKIF